jgi:hypothetical protein
VPPIFRPLPLRRPPTGLPWTMPLPAAPALPRAYMRMGFGRSEGFAGRRAPL